MLALVFDTSFYIDVLTYVLNSEDKVIGKQVIDIFYAEKNDSPGINSPVNRVCINTLNSIVSEEIDIKNEGQLAAIEFKIRESRAAKKDAKVFDSLRKILVSSKIDSQKLTTLKKTIFDKMLWYKSYKPIKKMVEKSQQYVSSSDAIAKTLALNDIEKASYELLKSFETPLDDKRYLEYINFGNVQHIEKAFEIHNNRTEESVFKTGHRGLNDLLGQYHGLLPGQMVAIIAMSSHHKTGTLLNFVRWICTLNNPWQGRVGKPSIVLFSLEEDINNSTHDLYNMLYSITTGHPPEDKPIIEIARYVYNEFSKRGFTLHLFRESSGEFTVNDYKKRCSDLIDQGWDIQASIIDYFTLMKVEDYSGGNRSQNIKAGLEQLKSFGKRHGILQISGFQAHPSNVAMEVGKGINPVKRYNPNVLSDAKSVFDSLDVVIYQHIEENHRGQRYLTYGFGKYRGLKRTMKHRTFAAYAFQTFGIPDDIDGNDISVDDIYLDQYDDDISAPETVDMFG